MLDGNSKTGVKLTMLPKYWCIIIYRQVNIAIQHSGICGEPPRGEINK